MPRAWVRTGSDDAHLPIIWNDGIERQRRTGLWGGECGARRRAGGSRRRPRGMANGRASNGRFRDPSQQIELRPRPETSERSRSVDEDGNATGQMFVGSDEVSALPLERSSVQHAETITADLARTRLHPHDLTTRRRGGAAARANEPRTVTPAATAVVG